MQRTPEKVKAQNGRAEDLTREAIRALLEGRSFDEHEMGEYGPWEDEVRNLLNAHDENGPGRIKEVWNALITADPNLNALVSADAKPITLATEWKRQLLTLADISKPLPPIEYIISGLFTLPSLNVVFGPPGSFKTMLLQDAAICVAGGRPWLPPLPGRQGQALPTSQHPILWVDFDNGERRIKERFAALKRGHKLPNDAPIHALSMPTPWLDAGEWDAVELVGEVIQHIGARLMVIDNLGLITGGADENTTDMAQVMGNLRRLCELTHCAVVLVHHQRKSQPGSGGRTGDSLRGHSSIEAAIDLALQVEREANSGSITVTATKTRGADVLPFGAQFAYDPPKTPPDLHSAQFYGIEIADDRSDSSIDDAIIDALDDGRERNTGTLEQEVQKLIKVGKDRVRARIENLASTGRLVERSGEKNARLFALAHRTTEGRV